MDHFTLQLPPFSLEDLAGRLPCLKDGGRSLYRRVLGRLRPLPAEPDEDGVVADEQVADDEGAVSVRGDELLLLGAERVEGGGREPGLTGEGEGGGDAGVAVLGPPPP